MKKLYVKIRQQCNPNGNPCIGEIADVNFKALVEWSEEVGEEYIVSAVRIEESEFKNLPEFQGF